MKRQEALSVGEIINMAIARTGHSDEYQRQQACYLWQEIVGPGINRHTLKRYVDRDVMHVYLSSASLKNELTFHSAALVEKINQMVGTNVITKIIFH